MNRSTKFVLGEPVKVVPQHWLRGGEIGQLVCFEPRGQNNWLVQFDTTYPGGGIDGNKLWFDPRDLIPVTERDAAPEAEGRVQGERFAVEMHQSSDHRYKDTML